MVGGLLGRNREELYLVLFVVHSVEGEIADLRVSVFDFSTGMRYILHAPCAEIVEFGKRGRFMVTALVVCGNIPRREMT